MGCSLLRHRELAEERGIEMRVTCLMMGSFTVYPLRSTIRLEGLLCIDARPRTETPSCALLQRVPAADVIPLVYLDAFDVWPLRSVISRCDSPYMSLGPIRRPRSISCDVLAAATSNNCSCRAALHGLIDSGCLKRG